MDRTGRVSHRQQELPGTRQSPEEVYVRTCRGVFSQVLKIYLHLWSNEQLRGRIKLNHFAR